VTVGLFPRAVAAFLAMPGLVAYVVPWLMAPSAPRGLAGIGLVIVGTLGLLWCVREFYVAGRGTLAPWSPPRTLGVTGPYRLSRNPMYVAVLVILAGWALAFRSWSLAGYAVVIAIAFQLRIVFNEEPWLARTQHAAWPAYAARVPRWFTLRRD
jgi:protein-S-isoprenylcysteine O-methyltransferase Ste14